jgi:hypothetical protein
MLEVSLERVKSTDPHGVAEPNLGLCGVSFVQARMKQLIAAVSIGRLTGDWLSDRSSLIYSLDTEGRDTR